MTELADFTGGSRLRATVDATTYSTAPAEARDPSKPLTIHWALDPVVNGTALDGARWALSWSLSQIFGASLGALLEQATLSNVERWNGSSWELIA